MLVTPILNELKLSSILLSSINTMPYSSNILVNNCFIIYDVELLVRSIMFAKTE